MSLTRKLIGCVLVACFSFPAFAANNDAAQANDVQDQQQVAEASSMNKQAQEQQMQPVNINTATVEQLETVKGIGKKRAQAIVAHREKNGPFKSVDDLASVKGFGKHFVEKHRASLTVS